MAAASLVFMTCNVLLALTFLIITADARMSVAVAEAASSLPAAISISQPHHIVNTHVEEIEDTTPAVAVVQQPANNGHHLPPLLDGELPNYIAAGRTNPPQSLVLDNGTSGILKRMLYGKESSSSKTKRQASRYKPKKTIKKLKLGPSYQKPKLAKRKAGTKATYIKKKVIGKAKTKATKYEIRSPTPTSYMPKRRSTRTMNPIDDCWRNDPNWAQNRMHLADCAIGYGFDATGGKGGAIYVVTDPSDDPTEPKLGTLRYGVVQLKPLWIIFDRDMSINLKNELIVTSYKTIDGRGAHVEISHGPCFTIQNVDHIIIHGLSIHHCTPGKSGRVMSSTAHVGDRQGSDGDAIVIFGSSHIWIDHNYFAACQDGLVDAIHGSTAITISNNFFTDHDKVMLLGHSDSYSEDQSMRVTIAYNHFGPGLMQRMPRCRFGYFHVVNNKYTKWGMYAIGASANPTIKSEGNYFFAPDDQSVKQVVKLEGARRTSSSNWKSNGDLFLNGAYFGEDGTSTYNPSYPDPQEDFDVLSASLVPLVTADAGPLDCTRYSRC